MTTQRWASGALHGQSSLQGSWLLAWAEWMSLPLALGSPLPEDASSISLLPHHPLILLNSSLSLRQQFEPFLPPQCLIHSCWGVLPPLGGFTDLSLAQRPLSCPQSPMELPGLGCRVLPSFYCILISAQALVSVTSTRAG
jgi:hypothetical protein